MLYVLEYIDNLWMVSSRTNLPIPKLREDRDNDEGDFRRITPQVWSLFEEWYGGGPAISVVGPPVHEVHRWVVHYDGIVGELYGDDDSDDGSESSEHATLHFNAKKATPDELQQIAKITRF